MSGRIEKTVFISYRRANKPWALFIYQNLTLHGFDVFIDFQNINSGNFETAIIDNIKARAHFIIVLTPSALERCKEPADWLRKEIETALNEKRNIIPVMVEGFDFGSELVKSALTGKMSVLSDINGLRIPDEYPFEAMDRLRERYLNIKLSDVILPKLPEEAQEITSTQKSIANMATPITEEQLTAQTWFERGYVFQNDHNYEEAIRCFSEAIKLDNNFIDAYGSRGNAFRDNGEIDKAYNDYNKILDINANDERTYINLGLLLHKDLNRSKEGEIALRKAIELNPFDSLAYFNLGVLLGELKRDDEAITVYRKTIELNPTFMEAYCNLGIILNKKKLYQDAETLYRKAIDLNPFFPEVHLNLGALLSDDNLRRYDEAELAFKKVLDLNPSEVRAYYNRADLMYKKKKYNLAIKNYQKYLEMGGGEKYSNLESVKKLIKSIKSKSSKKKPLSKNK